MSQQVLYRKWRSSTFDELVGQPHVVQTLQNALETGRVAHAYLFSGPRGTGKTSTARILAKAVNCLAPEGQRPCNECHLCRSITDGSCMDLIEIDAASNTQVDKVRDVIIEKVNFAPTEARRKVYLLDEIHMLSTSAFNALLKTIEEPPPHAMFMLATTEIHKIPATILSRCQRLDFRRIGLDEVAAHLGWVLEQEGITAEPQVLELAARQATGSMRDALSLLDQLLAHGGTHLTLAQARAALGLASAEAVEALVGYLLAQEVGGALRLVSRLMDQGTDPRQFLTDVLEHLRALLLTLAGGGTRLPHLPQEAQTRLRAQVRHLDPGALVEVIRRFNQAGADLKLGLQPQLPIELAVVEAVLLLQARGLTPAPMPGEALADAEEAPAAVRPARPRPLTPPVTLAPEPAIAREPEPSAPEPVAPAAAATHDEPRPAPARMEPEPAPRTAPAPRRAPDAGPPSPPPWDEDELIPPPSASVLRERPLVLEEAIPTDSEGHSLGWWQAQWEEFKTFLARQGNDGQRVALRVKFAEPHAVDDGTLTLAFAYTIHLEKLAPPAERSVVERALAAFGGGPLAVRCVLVPKDQKPQPLRSAREQARDEALRDPLVREAQRLGGQFVDVTLPE